MGDYMVSKEKYKEFINDMMKEDPKFEYNKKRIAKYGTDKYRRASTIPLFISVIFFLAPIVILIAAGGEITITYVEVEINSFASFMRYLYYKFASSIFGNFWAIGVIFFVIG